MVSLAARGVELPRIAIMSTSLTDSKEVNLWYPLVQHNANESAIHLGLVYLSASTYGAYIERLSMRVRCGHRPDDTDVLIHLDRSFLHQSSELSSKLKRTQ